MSRYDNDPTFRANRQRRLEELAAKRNTPEWAAAGAALVNQRAEADAARRRDVEAARRAEAQRRRDEKPVGDDELRRAVDQCEDAIRVAAADTGYEPDVIAYDIIVGQCLSFRVKLAQEVKRVMLGITPDDEAEVEELMKQLLGH